MSLLLEQALRVAAFHHQGQTRKGGQLPYIIHPTSVAMILAQHGYEDDLLATALLHDVLEDTNCTAEQLRETFPAHIVEWVIHLSEIKHDAQGEKIPWKLRKELHLERIRSSDWQVRAVKLADKIHNMQAIIFDLTQGLDAWSVFSAPAIEVLWYYKEALEACDPTTPQLRPLVALAQQLINQLAERLPQT